MGSDLVFSGIFKACAANPDQCSLARPGKSAADLERSVWDLFETLKRRPIPIGTLTLDDNVLRRFVSSALYTTTLWKNLTSSLDMLVSGNVSEQLVLENMGGVLSADDLETKINQTVASIMPFLGIHCGDRAARARTFDNVLPAILRLFQTSKIMGGIASFATVTCAQWQLEPKERYRGNFDVQPRRPVLVVGNTYDALTPMASAHNVSSGFKGSVVLEVNGYGVSDGSLFLLPAYTSDGYVAYIAQHALYVRSANHLELLAQRGSAAAWNCLRSGFSAVF